VEAPVPRDRRGRQPPVGAQRVQLPLVYSHGYGESRPSWRTVQRISARIGAKTTQRIPGRGASRWVPIAGALGVAGYAYYDTSAVGQTAMDLSSKDLDGDVGSQLPEGAPKS